MTMANTGSCIVAYCQGFLLDDKVNFKQEYMCAYANEDESYTYINHLHSQQSLALLVGLSQICSKSCPKCFWNIPKTLAYYALQASHYVCIMLQYERH